MFINLVKDVQSSQISFVGGRPNVPDNFEIPKCLLCGSDQAFFLQIELPADCSRSGEVMAIFQCTSCVHEDALIPKMIDGVLKNAVISENFIKSYQKNFRVIFFSKDNINVMDDYIPRIDFREINLLSSKEGVILGRVGGKPAWVMEDEAPCCLDNGKDLNFVVQLNMNFEYEIVSGAPRQIVMDIFGSPRPSDDNYYRLFIGNEVYIFVNNDGYPLPYVITQIE